MRNETLRRELLRMHAADDRAFTELAGRGTDREYDPVIESLHRRNAMRLAEILADFGWPGRALVGEAGMRAAWRIAQHAISLPDVQRRALDLLRIAVQQDEAPGWQAAYLEDRIRICEGKPQLYGTQFDWDEHGCMSPCPIEDPEGVNERRRAVGLRPLEEDVQESRRMILESGEQPPADYHARRQRIEAWARATGWRD